MQHVLVTGGGGYIGSHVCKALSEKGYVPVTIDDLSLGHDWAVKWGPFVHGNCGDQKLLQKTFDTYPIMGVIHLAALSNARKSHEIPLSYYQNNVSQTLNLLEILKEQQIFPFVFSSTAAVYGMPKKSPIDETHPKCPTSPYGESKWMVEKILETSPFNVACLRYFNAAGADIFGEIGEEHALETHLIPSIIQTAIGKRPSFILYGTDHKTPDGTPIRDYIHVTDLAKAHVLAFEYLIQKERNLTLNLGTGNGYSVLEIISAIENLKKCKIPVIKSKRFQKDPPSLIANGQKAMKVLGWKPKYSDLETIIETAWNWHNAKALK